MSLDRYILGDSPRELVGDGRHSIEPSSGPGWFEVRCTGVDDAGTRCGWSFRTLAEFREIAEELGWMHVSRPSLIIAGSTDVARERRLEIMRQEGKAPPDPREYG